MKLFPRDWPLAPRHNYLTINHDEDEEEDSDKKEEEDDDKADE